jgi:integrase
MYTLRQGVRSALSYLEEYETLAIVSAKPRHIARNAAIVRRFVFEAGIASAASITPATVQMWIARQLRAGVKTKTVRNHVASLSAFCEHLVTARVLSDNACRMVKTPRPEEPPIIYLTDAEQQQALSLALEHGIYGEVGLAMYSGLRREELRTLQWAFVDFAGKIVQVANTVNHTNKNRRGRSVPIGHSLLPILEHQRDKTGGRQFVFSTRMDRQRPRAGRWWDEALSPLQREIGKFRQLPEQSTGRGWHIFRHTFATMCLRKKVHLDDLREWLGHSDWKMVKRYAHIVAGYNPDIERI